MASPMSNPVSNPDPNLGPMGLNEAIELIELIRRAETVGDLLPEEYLKEAIEALPGPAFEPEFVEDLADGLLYRFPLVSDELQQTLMYERVVTYYERWLRGEDIINPDNPQDVEEAVVTLLAAESQLFFRELTLHEMCSLVSFQIGYLQSTGVINEEGGFTRSPHIEFFRQRTAILDYFLDYFEKHKIPLLLSVFNELDEDTKRLAYAIFHNQILNSEFPDLMKDLLFKFGWRLASDEGDYEKLHAEINLYVTAYVAKLPRRVARRIKNSPAHRSQICSILRRNLIG